MGVKPAPALAVLGDPDHGASRVTTGLALVVVITCLIAVLSLAALYSVPLAAASEAESCPNDQYRIGYAAHLPDCRAYELVSPPGIQPYFATFGSEGENFGFQGGELGTEQGVVASVGGESASSGRIAYFSTFAPSGSNTDGPYYLSSRTGSDWVTANVIPPQSTEVTPACLPFMVAWSQDLTKGVLADGYKAHANICGQDEPELVPGEPRGAENLFLWDASTGAYDLVDRTPPSATPADAFYQAASSDLGEIVFSESAALTPNAPQGSDFYVFAHGTVRLLTILPDGSTTQGELADATKPIEEGPIFSSATFTHAVAPDGTRAVFTAGEGLYVREHPDQPQSALDGGGACIQPEDACTVQVDAAQGGPESGGGKFMGTGSTSATVVLFSDERRLTSDSTAASSEPDLYEYDFAASAGQRLVDLTVSSEIGGHADVKGLVGTNEEGVPGAYIYFVASGVLASGAQAGEPNLYLEHAGVTRYITTLAAVSEEGVSPDSCDWGEPTVSCLTARVSPNGQFVGFDSIAQLTGYDNVPPLAGDCTEQGVPQACQEIFLYDAGASLLSCASCGSGGSAPTAPSGIHNPEANVALPSQPRYLQRNVTNSGQVFFDTATRLVPQAANAQPNVYEYEHGALALLSSGTSSFPSYFYDATVNGSDVFIVSDQSLVPGADDAELAVYDARVDGGLPQVAGPTPPCDDEECRGQPNVSAINGSLAPTTTLEGNGNLVPLVRQARPKLTRAELLKKSLKACRHRFKRGKRIKCEADAHRKYGQVRHVKAKRRK